MSFIAKLFLDGTERPVLYSHIRMYKNLDASSRPDSLPNGGIIKLILSGPHKDLFSWMVSQDMMKNGLIRYYERDGISIAADLEFWDCCCHGYKESFTQFDASPYTTEITLTPAIVRLREATLEKNWKVTDLSRAATGAVAQQPQSPQEKPQVVECFMEDAAGNPIKKARRGQTIFLTVKTKEMVGKKINIDLGDSKIDFEHKGERLENDLLQDYAVTADVMKIELKAIKRR